MSDDSVTADGAVAAPRAGLAKCVWLRCYERVVLENLYQLLGPSVPAKTYRRSCNLFGRAHDAQGIVGWTDFDEATGHGGMLSSLGEDGYVEGIKFLHRGKLSGSLRPVYVYSL